MCEYWTKIREDIKKNYQQLEKYKPLMIVQNLDKYELIQNWSCSTFNVLLP
jgi:hypothetical protein